MKIKDREINNSKLDLYRACPRLFKRTVLDGVEVPFEASPALDYGTALHAGLEAYLTNENGAIVFETILRTSKSFKRPADLQRHIDMGKTHLSKFQRFHLKHFANVVSEKRLVTSLKDYTLAGTPDLVCDYKGVKSVVDFKTSARTYDKDIIYTEPQMKQYCLMLKTLGVEVKQIVYMVFVKDTTCSIQEPLVRKINAKELDEFACDLLDELDSIENDTTFRKNPKACFNKYGRACPMLGECFPEYKKKGDK